MRRSRRASLHVQPTLQAHTHACCAVWRSNKCLPVLHEGGTHIFKEVNINCKPTNASGMRFCHSWNRTGGKFWAMGAVVLVTTWLWWLQLNASAKNSCAAKANWVCMPGPVLRYRFDPESAGCGKETGECTHACGQISVQVWAWKTASQIQKHDAANLIWQLKKMLGLFWLSFTVKSLNYREELASTEFPPCHWSTRRCPLYITWGRVNILPASSFMTVKAMCRNCCSMCLRCDSFSGSLFTGRSVWF